MIKAQRSARAKRAGAKRRKAAAITQFMKKMNPSRKVPAAVRVKRLKGGGFSVTPVKLNASIRKTLKGIKTYERRAGKTERHELTKRLVKGLRRSRRRSR